MINKLSKRLSPSLFIKQQANKGPEPNNEPSGSAGNPAGRGASPVPPRVDPEKVKLSASLAVRDDHPGPFLYPLPAFRDVPPADRRDLFIKKLHLCCYTFDFTDPSKHVKEKETKRQTLMQLMEYVTSGPAKFTEDVFEDITNMIVANLFRSLPPSSHENTGADAIDPDEEEITTEPAWPHLQIVYEFLLRFVVSPEIDPKVAKMYIDRSLVLGLLELFDSEDPREREYVKTILHRICNKFVVHRPFIRTAMNNIVYRFMFETEKHNGIAELLEILGSIINGFALPLRPQHRVFLERALIPLHKRKCLEIYHQQLSYCVTKFVEKDPKLADTVIRGLLKYWPVTNSQKEIVFLGELEEVLEGTQPAEVQQCMVPLFRQMTRCLNSPHFQVAERALTLCSNDRIMTLVAQNRHVVLPLIFASLERNTSHWNRVVKGLGWNVRKIFLEMDLELCQECQRKLQEDESKAKEVDEKREAIRKSLEAAVSQRSVSTENMLDSLGMKNDLAYGKSAMVGG